MGTGGASMYALLTGERPANLALAQDNAFGILRITLRRAGYSWEWNTAGGQPGGFTDTRTTTVKCA